MSSRTEKFLRIAGLIVLVGGLVFAGTRPGVQAYFELEYLRETTSNAGALGIFTFLGLWIAAYQMQIPGIVFILAALLGWGPYDGVLISFAGLTLATGVSFWLVRVVGGSPLSELESDWVRKVLGQLDDRPVRTVALLRLVFLVNPVVNLSLILTDVRFRDYIVGSMIGFVLPLAVITLATDTVMYFTVAT